MRLKKGQKIGAQCGARPWFRGSAKVPVMDVPFETAAEQINCVWPTAKDKKINEFADVSLSIFVVVVAIKGV